MGAWSGTTCSDATLVYTWDQANALTGTTTFAGHSDWRLPNLTELSTIFDRSVSNPAINLVAFPNAAGTSDFWSASASAGDSSYAWGIYFGFGSASSSNKSYAFQVRLVRAGQSFDPLVTTTTSTTATTTSTALRTTTTVAPTTTTSTVATTTTTTQVACVGWSVLDSTTPGIPGDTLTLTAGWNLLGNGWNQTLPVASVFGDVARVTTVWKWDVAKIGWQFYSPTMTTQELQNYATGKGYGVLSAVGAGEGFWVNVKRAFTVTLPNGPTVIGVDFQSGSAKALDGT